MHAASVCGLDLRTLTGRTVMTVKVSTCDSRSVSDQECASCPATPRAATASRCSPEDGTVLPHFCVESAHKRDPSAVLVGTPGRVLEPRFLNTMMSKQKLHQHKPGTIFKIALSLSWTTKKWSINHTHRNSFELWVWFRDLVEGWVLM